MNRCPITYELCGESLYSSAGLRALSPNLEALHDFPYDAAHQRREAIVRAAKMSIHASFCVKSDYPYPFSSPFSSTDCPSLLRERFRNCRRKIPAEVNCAT